MKLIGEWLWNEWNFDKAKIHFQESINIDSNNVLAYINLAVILEYQFHDYGDAINL